ncbi:MAG: hypothetical protein JRJ58_05940 [Deltaproteobacteria bacterium]|nr:hypothetical protein [Deltaproteobacteria bacterium]
MATSTALDERLQNRRRRRWNRRARILGPFLALPVLVATLLLSVDIVEYRPEESNEKPTAHSIDRELLEARSSHLTRAAISTAAFAPENPIAGFESGEVDPFEVDLELGLPQLELQTLRTPTAPYAPRR